MSEGFEEGFDLPDPAYLAWKSANHSSPESISSANAATSLLSVGTTASHKSSGKLLDEMFTLLQPLSTGSGKSNKAVKTKAVITDDDILQKKHAAAEAKTKKKRITSVTTNPEPSIAFVMITFIVFKTCSIVFLYI